MRTSYLAAKRMMHLVEAYGQRPPWQPRIRV